MTRSTVPHDKLLEMLKQWTRSELGCYVHALEQEALNQLLPRFFGYHLLQVSLHDNVFDYSASPIRERAFVNLDTCAPKQAPIVRAKSGELPFASNSMDVVVLPHILEIIHEPEVILQEACRVVIPEGQIIIFGFNPYSLWGMSKLVRGGAIQIPWSNRFLPPNTVQNWLTASDFDILRRDYQLYQPPRLSFKQQSTKPLLEKVGHKCWPQFGALYTILAQKKQLAVRPLRPQWKKKTKLKSRGVIETCSKNKVRRNGQD